ncbi:MAG: ribA/ribD-fused uncharacterized protein [Flavobacteriales bacterium]|jgi:ribA/ribD-fused uncharacterized protein
MKFKELSKEQITNLSPLELRNYLNSFRANNEKLNNEKWLLKSSEEKKQSILSDYHFYINKRGIEGITLEEQIEFGLNNEPSEKANYVTPLVEHYHSVKKNETYTYFWETASPYSQWYKSKFIASTCLIEGVSMNKVKREFVLQNHFPFDVQEYSSAEQFMMFQKSIIFLDLDSAKKIMSTTDVSKIKKIGRKVSGFNENIWKYYRSKIVYEGNKAKFEQNENLKEELLKTKGTTIVEASPYDKIWGIGLTADDLKSQSRKTWNGLNLLGEILTYLRIELSGTY